MKKKKRKKEKKKKRKQENKKTRKKEIEKEYYWNVLVIVADDIVSCCSWRCNTFNKKSRDELTPALYPWMDAIAEDVEFWTEVVWYCEAIDSDGDPLIEDTGNSESTGADCWGITRADCWGTTSAEGWLL